MSTRIMVDTSAVENCVSATTQRIRTALGEQPAASPTDELGLLLGPTTELWGVQQRAKRLAGEQVSDLRRAIAVAMSQHAEAEAANESAFR